jgi:hypothetical protein
LHGVQGFFVTFFSMQALALCNALRCRHFLFLDEKKVTKEKSSQARSLRAA